MQTSNNTIKTFIKYLSIRAIIQGILYFIGWNIAVAETLQESIQIKVNNYNSILTIIYIILRPFLVIAGKALDNSFVYGSFFNLDAPLRTIWQIIRNFANFGLGFFVLREILKNIFDFGKWGDLKDFTGWVIKKAVIAGIGIQASWFVVAAMIDLSTIATYSIGWLPLSILGQTQNQCVAQLGDQKVLGVYSKIDLSNSNQSLTFNERFSYYYYTKNNGQTVYYSPCFTKNNYVVGRTLGWPQDPSFLLNTGQVFTQPNICVLGWNRVVKFSQEPAFDIDATANSYSDYTNALQIALSSGNIDFTWRQQNGQAFDIDSQTSYPDAGSNSPGIYNMRNLPDNNTIIPGTFKLKQIMERAEGNMGPLVTLYHSILNFVQFNSQTSSYDNRGMLIEAGIKTLFAFALVIPLIITGLVLIKRIWYLWLLIATSPLLVLRYAFKGTGEDILKLWYSLTDWIKLIFAPVFIVFAVSISLIFMSTLTNGFANKKGDNACVWYYKDVYQDGFDIDIIEWTNGEQLVSVLNDNYRIGFDLSDENRWGYAKDFISWIIINMFGIGITRTILFMAISATKVGEWYKERQSGIRKTIGSIPIVPLPTGKWVSMVGAGTAMNIANKAIDNTWAAIQRLTDTPAWFGWQSNNSQDNTNQNNTNNTNNNTNNVTNVTNKITSLDNTALNPSNTSSMTPQQITQAINDAYDAKRPELVAEISKNFKTNVPKALQQFQEHKKELTVENMKNITNGNDVLSKVLTPVINTNEYFTIQLGDGKTYTFTKDNTGKFTAKEATQDEINNTARTYEALMPDWSNTAASKKKIEDIIKKIKTNTKKTKEDDELAAALQEMIK